MRFKLTDKVRSQRTLCNIAFMSFVSVIEKLKKPSCYIIKKLCHLHECRELSVMSLNCQSIRNKVNETLELMSSNSIDILFVQETWLRKSDTPIMQQIREAGYELFTERKCRKIDRGGGVGVIFKNIAHIMDGTCHQ